MKVTLLFESNKGVQFVRKDYTKRSVVRVGNKNYNNIHYRTYRMNNVPFYQHQYLSWENLNCCGGWVYDDNYLYTAVQKNKKLVSGVGVSADTDDFDIAASKIKERIPNINDEKESVYISNEPREGYGTYYWNAAIIRKGCLNDYYDLDEIKDVYKDHDIIIKEEQQLKEYFHIPLVDLFAKHEKQFDYFNPWTDVEIIVTGLGLGYPIESTASIINYY